MSQLIESISIKHGKPQHLNWHIARIRKARKALFDLENHLSIEATITQAQARNTLKAPWQKCRIIYAQSIEKIEFEAYCIRPVQSLQIVEDNTIDYSYKYKDRSTLDRLFAQRGTCDNILIVKNGWITDSYYANVVLEQAGKFFTPRLPLLNGIQRQRLLAQNQLQCLDIAPREIMNFQHIHLINAFLSLGDCMIDTRHLF
ncbi:MAG: aminotransferase class IV [Bacteroidota bacterium]